MLNKNELQTLKNKEYKFFVCNVIEGLEVLCGWEYKEDALDDMNELKEVYEFNCINEELKVYTKRYINTLYKNKTELFLNI